MRYALVVLCIFCTSNLLAQREAANWFFGQNAGLSFNSGAPVVLEGGQINTVEGCEAFSDANGNLLFYTDGKTVWNRSHRVMPNGEGLKGSFSTSQSALVVPRPEFDNTYYVFTPDDALSRNFGDNSNGFNYSVVDMSLAGGSGDVTEKNVTLLPQGSEKVSAVRNAEDDFYWVVTHYRNQFYAYKVDETGVNTTPIVSTTGPLIQEFENIRGSLKISPDGTRLAITHTIVEPEFQGSFYLFDFDVNTGTVSNPINVSDSRLYYGVEFSSDSSKLYASGMGLTVIDGERAVDKAEIVQFDLNVANISGSEYLVKRIDRSINGFVAGALQIAIDRKIYHAIPDQSLSVIRTPNLKGLDSDFRLFAVDLASGQSTYGLPPFIQSFFETIVTIENFCEGDVTTFTTDSTGAIASIHWNFGDLLSGAQNTSSDLNPTHVFTTHGIYTVTIQVEYTNGSSKTFIEFVEIAEVPDVVSQVNLVQCDSDGADDGISLFNLNEAIALFNNGNEDITGLFFHTITDAQNNTNVIDPIGYQNIINGEVLYARAFENSECFEIVEVTLTVEPLSDLGHYGEVFICNGEIGILATIINIQEAYDGISADFPEYETLKIFISKEDALLETNELELADRTFGPFDPHEVYFRLENDNACAQVGMATLNVQEKPEFEEIVEVQRCNHKAVLVALDGYSTYIWPDGSSEREFVVDSTGTFDVLFGNGDCLYMQSFVVVDRPDFEISNILINDFRPNNSIEIQTQQVGERTLKYSIDGGITFQGSPFFSRVLPGMYEVVVSDDCLETSESVMVGGAATFFTPNNDGINDTWSLSNSEYFPNTRISIYDKYGKLLRSFDSDQVGWDGTFNSRQMPADDYWYKLELEAGRVVTGHFTLKR